MDVFSELAQASASDARDRSRRGAESNAHVGVTLVITKPDQAVLMRARNGDQSAWNQLVDAYDRLVWHVILGAGARGEDAADVHQTVWLRLAEHLDEIREADRIGSWLATTARREWQRVSIARSKTIAVGLDIDRVPDERVEDHLLTTERDIELRNAFELLSAACKELLRLMLADPPLRYEEIGALLQMPVGSIGPTRVRCLERLARSPGVKALRGST